MAGKVNLSQKKVEMPVRDPKERARVFQEVATGYTPEMAMEEATRCLHCKAAPCVKGCPVGVQIPNFIQEIVKGDFAKAYQVITQTNRLPAVCGRVCPQENQCEGLCVRGKKANRLALAAWSGLLRITPATIQKKQTAQKNRLFPMGKKWQSLAEALLV